METFTNEMIWGDTERRQFTPPPEVIKQILADPEIAIDFPNVYAEAVRIEKSRLTTNH
jgi:hypothetical protein